MRRSASLSRDQQASNKLAHTVTRSSSNNQEFGERPILICRLRGGLGNQLFQYAAAKGIAHRNELPLYLDTVSGFIGDQNSRRYELEPFAITAGILPQEHRLSLKSAALLACWYRCRRELISLRCFGRTFDRSTLNLRPHRTAIL